MNSPLTPKKMRYRKASSALSIVALLTLGLLGCSSESTSDGETSTATIAEKTTVYVGNYPLQYFAERIAGDTIAVTFPAGTAGDPAYWKPTPEETVAMQGADLILLNGATYEQWLKNVSLPPSRLVDTTAAMQDQLLTSEMTETHSHGDEGEHTHTATAFTTWLNPALAIEQARAIKDALVKLRPEQQTDFTAGFDALKSDLESLDAEIAAVFKGQPDRPLLFSHPVYQYFQEHYGLNGKSVHWEPDGMPDDAMWAALSELLTTHPATLMMWEGSPLPEVSEKLKTMGITCVDFDPCGATPDSGDYLVVMKNNLAAIKAVY